MAVFSNLSHLSPNVHRQQKVGHQFERGHDTDHCVTLIIERDVLVDNVNVTAEALPPNLLADYDYISTRFVLTRKKAAAESRRNTKHVEKLRSDVRCTEICSITSSGEI